MGSGIVTELLRFGIPVSDEPELSDLTQDQLRERARKYRESAERQTIPRLSDTLRRLADLLDALAARREAGQSN